MNGFVTTTSWVQWCGRCRFNQFGAIAVTATVTARTMRWTWQWCTRIAAWQWCRCMMDSIRTMGAHTLWQWIVFDDICVCGTSTETFRVHAFGQRTILIAIGCTFRFGASWQWRTTPAVVTFGETAIWIGADGNQRTHGIGASGQWWTVRWIAFDRQWFCILFEWCRHIGHGRRTLRLMASCTIAAVSCRSIITVFRSARHFSRSFGFGRREFGRFGNRCYNFARWMT